MVSFAYLRLLIFLLAILIPACASSSLTFRKMYSAGWQYTALTYSFTNLEPVHCSMSSSNCCILTHKQVSQETGKVVWYCHQFSSVARSCLTLCDPMDWSMPGFPVHYQLLQLAQIHVHRVCDAIQPSLLAPSPPAFNLSQHQGLFQWVSSSHQVAKVLELQHESSQWIFRTDFL